MIDLSKAKNPRTNDMEKYINCDVLLNGLWCDYTTTPDDSISSWLYFEFKKSGATIVAPSKDYIWKNNEWVPYGEKEFSGRKRDKDFDNLLIIKELTPRIEALKDKIEFGMSTDTEADKAELLRLRKERASLI